MLGAACGFISSLPVHVRCQFPAILQREPQTGRKHDARRIIDGAEIALTHPKGKLDKLRLQHGLLIELRKNCLQFRLFRQFLFSAGQHDAVGYTIAVSKGHGNAHTGFQRSDKFLGDQIIKRPVNGVGSGRHRNFCNCCHDGLTFFFYAWSIV